MSFDKSKLPSRHVSVGPERAPHRSYYYAMGMTEEEIARPWPLARRHAPRRFGRHAPCDAGRQRAKTGEAARA